MGDGVGLLRTARVALGLGLGLSGCSEPIDSRPPDVPGTMETALRLTLGAEARIKNEETLVEICLTPDGLCVPADFRVDECYRYEGIQAFIDGVELPLAWSGGWSPGQRFEPLPSGGNGYGCSYPMFETTDLGLAARSAAQEIAIRIGDEEVVIELSEWLTDLKLSVPDTLVRGTEILVGVDPIHGTERQGVTGTAFIYENLDGDDPNKWFEMGTIEPQAWSENGVSVLLPADMPIGIGSFRVGIGYLPIEPIECPFAKCNLTVSRVTQLDGMTVMEP